MKCLPVRNFFFIHFMLVRFKARTKLRLKAFHKTLSFSSKGFKQQPFWLKKLLTAQLKTFCSKNVQEKVRKQEKKLLILCENAAFSEQFLNNQQFFLSNLKKNAAKRTSTKFLLKSHQKFIKMLLSTKHRGSSVQAMCGGDKQRTFLIKSCLVCWLSELTEKNCDFFIGSFLAQARKTHNEIAEASNNRNSIWRDISQRNHNVFITFERYRWRGRASAVESSDLPAIRAVSLSRNKKGWKSERRTMWPDNPLTSWSGDGEAALQDTHQWHCSLASEVVFTNITKGSLFMCFGWPLRSAAVRTRRQQKAIPKRKRKRWARLHWKELMTWSILFRKSFLFTACLLFAWWTGLWSALLSFFCHATAIEWTAAGHKTQITITKGRIGGGLFVLPPLQCIRVVKLSSSILPFSP